MTEVFKELELPLPTEYLTCAEHVLCRQLEEEIAKITSPFTQDKFARTLEILQQAQELKLELKSEASQYMLYNFLTQKITQLKTGISLELLEEIVTLLEVSPQINPLMDKRIAQDAYFLALAEHREFLTKQSSTGKLSLIARRMGSIGENLGFNMERYLSLKEE